MWLASPALPVGGFSYSEALEAAVDAGWVHDEVSAGRWLRDQLQLVLVRSELPLLARALRAWKSGDLAEVQACNDWILHTRESREFRLQTEQMGRSLAQWLVSGAAERQIGDAPPQAPEAAPQAPEAALQARMLQSLPGGPTWPVAFALACAQAGATAEQALLTLAFSWCENQVQAAIKCVPLGQSAGQRVLAGLAREIESAVQSVAPDPQAVPPGPQAFAPGLAILSARHEQQYSRLFRS